MRMQSRVVVELLKIHLARSARSASFNKRAGRAVRLVGDGQIERWCAMARLGFRDPSQRLVRAKNHPGRAFAVERPRDLGRIRGDRALKLGNPDVLVLVASASGGIGTHDNALKLTRGLPEPFAPCLRDQRDSRGSKENPLSVLDNLFGDAKRSKGFAGAAGHDEAATVMVGKPGNRVLNRFFL